ncbi:GH20033 [Drosophila grimshawi]|uniref:GH20033 n=1 Tax=Drosophila grimshawi TaxID=7222 RepID=B4JRI1_DROGR|nr:GH20033 [Drosophila grimshawi]
MIMPVISREASKALTAITTRTTAAGAGSLLITIAYCLTEQAGCFNEDIGNGNGNSNCCGPANLCPRIAIAKIPLTIGHLPWHPHPQLVMLPQSQSQKCNQQRPHSGKDSNCGSVDD